MEPVDGLQMPPRMLVPQSSDVKDVERLVAQGWEFTGETRGGCLVYIYAPDA